jgi:electron transfer flavoprotein alpha subunit
MEHTIRWAILGNDGHLAADRIPQCLPENYAPLLVENIKKGGYTHVVAGHSAFGKNIMPRVSALLDTQQISDITAIESEDSM